MKIILNGNKYKTKEWERFRLSILARDNYTCQNCARKGIRKTANTVHHIDPDSTEEFLLQENLISVCATCHNEFHDRINKKLKDDGKLWLLRKRRGKNKNRNKK